MLKAFGVCFHFNSNQTCWRRSKVDGVGADCVVIRHNLLKGVRNSFAFVLFSTSMHGTQSNTAEVVDRYVLVGLGAVYGRRCTHWRTVSIMVAAHQPSCLCRNDWKCAHLPSACWTTPSSVYSELYERIKLQRSTYRTLFLQCVEMTSAQYGCLQTTYNSIRPVKNSHA